MSSERDEMEVKEDHASASEEASGRKTRRPRTRSTFCLEDFLFVFFFLLSFPSVVRFFSQRFWGEGEGVAPR